MFISKRKMIILWSMIGGLLIIIFAQSFGDHGFVMIEDKTKMTEVGIKNQTKDGMSSSNVSITPAVTEDEKICVCIQGAVEKPGNVILPKKSRLADGIKEAGGFLPDAETRYLNLAEFMEDGSLIYIQTKEEAKNDAALGVQNSVMNGINGEGATNKNKGQNSSSTKVNINTATIDELDTLPGVGKSTAEKIIAYRKEKGLFKKIEDLKEVSGIGDGKYNKLKDHIKI